VTRAQGGQAIAAVVAGIAVVAHADQRLVQQAHQQGQQLVARQAIPREVAAHPPAQRGQLPAERHYPVELAQVAELPPARVVTVLLAPARVAAGGLQVAPRVGADPHVGIGRRDRQRADARKLPAIAHRPPVGVAVAETLAATDPPQAGLRVTDVDQAHRARGGAWVGGVPVGCGHAQRVSAEAVNDG